MRKIVLENTSGDTIRFFSWEGEKGKLIRRNDNLRLELHDESQMFALKDVDFIEVSDIDSNSLNQGIEFQGLGRLRIVDDVTNTIEDQETRKDKNKTWWLALVVILCIGIVLTLSSILMPITEEVVEEEKEVKVEKIVKITPKIKIASVPTRSISTKPRKRSMKRVGALAVLGSLKSAKQNGGLNLGALKTSKGPGLGGSLGSGGVQTSIYAKGLVAAPLGAGANAKGAGGYGTKGKGGGQAGYGQLSMVGSSGNSSIALGESTVSNGGLDRDLIAAVIKKNMGQISFCYEQGLRSNPSLSGRVMTDFVIGANGRVSAAKMASSTLQSSMVESCILMRLRSWNFPKPTGGVSVKVKYPFVLKRLGQG